MLVSTVRQFGLRLCADPEEIPFQHSSNIQMQFIKDENYNDYTVVGYYIPPGENEAKLLSINDDGTFILGPDCFKQRGTLSFSFNLINSIEEVHLGSIDFEIRYAFGDSDTILPESEEVWISVVTKVAKDAIKDDVAVVQQKAKEALQSASLANDKASEAEEYANNANQSAGSASLSASSALTAKNDAIAASNSAIQAKQDAEQSANNAKNSANTALENANKSTEAIETVTQIKTEIENKANDFDTNYQEKLKSFNDNATSKQNAFDNSVQTANTNFDNKVTQANSDLDAKVQEATKQAQKAKEEADRATQATDGKLDKNLGVENAGKSLVVGENGEVVCGESGINEDEVNKIIDKAIDEKLYTQEEVDYLLNDKMDKPYYDIAITDDTTIENTLAGNFKMDSIEGSIYQAKESGIVPTPERPIPIRSKKITVNDEVVELRSLKESVNIWDYTNMSSSESGVINTSGWAIGVAELSKTFLKLKSNTQYSFKCDIEMVENVDKETLTKFSTNKMLYLYRVNSDDLPSVNIDLGSTDAELENGALITVSNTFTTPADLTGIRITAYTERWTNAENVAYYARVRFKNIMLVEGDTVPSSYIAPTVRDYKIVDHTTKTSKIVRNVKNIRVTSKLINNGFNDYTETMKRAIIRTLDRFVIDNVTKAGNDLSNMAITRFGSLQNGNVFADVSGIANMYWYPDISMFGLNGSEEKDVASQKLVEFLTNNEMYVQYQLATPVEQSIEYVKTDVSEVGYSWQDSTSPSPDIKSEIYEVDEINIKLIGKNFIDIDYISNIDNWTNPNTDGYYYIPIEVPKNAQLVISNDVKVPAGRGYYANFSPYKERNAENYYFIYHSVSGSALGKFTSITKSNVVYLRLNSVNVNLPLFVEDFKKMQLEIGSVATPYTPYQETSIQHTLSKPLRATKDGSIKDIIDIVNMQITYNMTDFIVDGNTTITLGTDKEKTRVIQINSFPFLNPTNNLKMCCDKLVNDSGKDEELFTVSTALYIAINKNRVAENDISEFKKWFGENPLYFIGISKNPTTEPLDDELVEKLKTLKTFSSVTHVFVEGIAKPKLNAKYPKDIAAAQAQLEAKVITLQEAVIKNV